jgi:drug/metabolite transporter (DMT)-like permease
MLWLFYALACAFFQATSDALAKKALQSSDEYTITWVRWGYSLPFLTLTLFLIEIPPLTPLFWLCLTFLVPLEITAAIMYQKAIKASPLSLSVPFLATTPVFLIFTAFILLQEIPDYSGIAGVLAIVAGSYLLHLDPEKRGFSAPFKALAREKGARLMLMVAFIYSLTSAAGKVAILNSSPNFFAIFYPYLLTLTSSPLVFYQRHLKGRGGKRPSGISYLYWFIGLSSALMIITHCLAIQLIEAVYMISVKRLSLLISVIYGGVIFQETNIYQRLLGASFMIAGVFLIAFL